MNTRDNRASAIAVGLAFRVLPLADAAINAADRQHAAFAYRGIAAAAPAVIVASRMVCAREALRTAWSQSREVIVRGKDQRRIVH